jgi:hypothetical protein
MAPNNLSMILNVRSSLKPEYGLRIARHFKITMEELYGDEEPPTKKKRK